MHINFRLNCLFLLTISLAFLACSNDDEPNPEPNYTYEDLENAFAAIDISPGIEDVTLQATNDIWWDFRAIAPEVNGSEKRPLIIALHGAYGGNTEAHKATACYIEPGLEELDAFIISPYGGPLHWYEPENQQQILTLINLAIKFWPVDEEKVAVTGYSNGGNGSWFYAETRSEIFSAGIPMASSYSTLNSKGTGRKIETPLYVIHGEGDTLFPIDSTQNWVDRSIEAGSNIEFVVAGGLSHYEPCDYVPYLQDAAVWLRDTIWD